MKINILNPSSKNAPNLAERTKIKLEEINAIDKFSRNFYDRINSLLIIDRPIILLCIGTDRSTGDSLGPLIGTKLLETKQNYFRVYGSLDQPVHAANLKEILAEISFLYRNPLIVAVDACLGPAENVGTINLIQGPLQPGAGVNKKLPPVGEMHITGIVNIGGFMEYVVLQNTRLSLVMRMAELITKGVCQSIKQFEKNKTQHI